MSPLTELGNALENFFAHGWGFVPLAIATLIGGIAVIDYFYEESLKKAIRKIRHRWSNHTNGNTIAPVSPPPVATHNNEASNITLSVVLLYKHDKPLDESS